MAQMDQLRESGAATIADQVQTSFGDHVADPTQWESPDEWLTEGPVELSGRTLEAVETPGHTAGHLVFYDLDAGLLFAGDHVLSTITPSIGFEPVMMANPLGAFLKSLALVRSRPDAVLLPAHGPVTPSVHARVDELLEHHRHRLDATEAAVRSGAGHAYEVGGVLRWTRREHRLSDLDTFNAMLAVLETGRAPRTARRPGAPEDDSRRWHQGLRLTNGRARPATRAACPIWSRRLGKPPPTATRGTVQPCVNLV
jgi:glyoxylase-like metal-dependent hydrolase (beta-lactamase superfamily II)